MKHSWCLGLRQDVVVQLSADKDSDAPAAVEDAQPPKRRKSAGRAAPAAAPCAGRVKDAGAAGAPLDSQAIEMPSWLPVVRAWRLHDDFLLRRGTTPALCAPTARCGASTAALVRPALREQRGLSCAPTLRAGSQRRRVQRVSINDAGEEVTETVWADEADGAAAAPGDDRPAEPQARAAAEAPAGAPGAAAEGAKGTDGDAAGAGAGVRGAAKGAKGGGPSRAPQEPSPAKAGKPAGGRGRGGGGGAAGGGRGAGRGRAAGGRGGKGQRGIMSFFGKK
jgi:hypothetical protein